MTPKKKTKRKRSRKKGARARKRPASAETEDVIVVPVRNMILFPGVALPLMIGRERSVVAVRAAVEDQAPVGLLLQRDEREEEPGPDSLYEVGTLAEVVRYWQAPDGRHQAICQGQSRFRVVEWLQQDPYPIARVQRVVPEEERTRAIEARFVALRDRALEVLSLAPGAPEDLAQAVENIESPAMLADLVATFMDATAREKQELLETIELEERLDKLIQALGKAAAVLALSAKIRDETKGALDKAQREYVLREQLRQIQRELGEDDEADDLVHLAEQLQSLALPEEARREVDRELRRLRRTPEQAGEHSMLRTWLEVVAELPWSERSSDRLDLGEAERVLDEDHYGLEDVKRRILEFLAVKKLNPSGQGQTLCLVGPPGVGKTSLGKSVARATGREFVRVSLGGVHDEGEVRGHRRTYVGAMLGKILDGLRRAGTRNPVFVLDEIDKLGHGLHGDPSAALLEVLDPAQNHSFRDNYLGVDFDLSEVFFVATGNVEESIPRPLRDRMEVVRIPGYTEEEKVQIARRYLVRRQLEAAGLTRSRVRISVGALREVVRRYTRESGVRELERRIGALCRHAATLFARRRRKPLSIRAEEAREILGPPPFDAERVQRSARPGVATGLAWTPVGGEVLFVEAARMDGTGKLVLTGHLGDVMKESATAALSLVKSRAEVLGFDAGPLAREDLHLHVPAGAVPKDGPSAGVAMYVALASLLTANSVDPRIAMTGEVSLQGLVLPVGGIKEKVLGALAAGVRTVLLPERNEGDLEKLPDAARERLEFVLLETVEDAEAVLFDGAPRGRALRRRARRARRA